MALIPTWYSASTKQIAEKALQRGVLKYPGLCYIQDSKSIAWVTIDNTLEYVKGDKQITDVKCIGSNLMFFSGDKLLFSYDISSSAGGAATSAIKLSTPRKIGNASFDGTADITLSQMGLNVPVEITKANYLAKKKAGTLNANTYYNVIDEYDSANVINDSSVTANSAFSSTKSEKTYAKKSTLVNTTLTASKWTGSSAPYSYVLSVSGVTSSNIVEIDYASNASSAAIEAYQNAMLADGGQTTNQITIKATEKPTVDIPITIVIRNDL